MGGCFLPPFGGTLTEVPSNNLRSACCTPSPETSLVIDGLSLFLAILSISSINTIPFSVLSTSKSAACKSLLNILSTSSPYGQKKADQVVITGIFASIFSIGLIFISSQVPAIEGSPIDDATFNSVFLNAPLAVLASMLTYLFAQFIDIRIYHYWKKLTKGKHLWLRNNFSTFTSQFVDTFTIVSLLILFGILPQDKIFSTNYIRIYI